MSLASLITKVSDLDPGHKAIWGKKEVEERNLPQDPRLRELARLQGVNADEFNASRGGMAAEGANLTGADLKAQLAAEMRGNAENASARGLLNSGIHRGADAGARARAAQAMAAARFNANQAVNAAGDEMDVGAVNTAMGNYGQEAAAAKYNYDSALKRISDSRTGFKALGQGLGAIGGMSLGKKKKGGGDIQAGTPEEGYAGADTGADYSGMA